MDEIVMEPAKQAPQTNNLNLSETELRQQIQAAEPQEQTIPADVVLEPVPGEVKPQEAEVKGSPVQTPVTEPQIAVTPEPDKVKEFLDKKHLAETDLPKLVDMYSNLEKEHTRKSQELAQFKKLPTPEPIVQNFVSPITGQPYVNETGQPITDPNAQLIDDLQKAPIATMKRIAELSYGDLVAPLKEQQLHNTLVRLSTSPQTAAEFNLPIVHEEIKKIFAENPVMTTDIPKNLPIAFDTALGRLYREGKLNKNAVEAGRKIAEQQNAVSQAAAMPTATKPQATVASKALKDMTTEEIAALIARAKWAPL